MPAVENETVRVATPLEFSVPVPMGFPPSKKVTVPVGAPAGEAIVAVRTVEPVRRTGLTELVSGAVEEKFWTASLTTVEVGA